MQLIIGSIIYTVEGVGEKTMKLLIQQFSSIEQIKTKSISELASVVGKSKASAIYNYFSKDIFLLNHASHRKVLLTHLSKMIKI